MRAGAHVRARRAPPTGRRGVRSFGLNAIRPGCRASAGDARQPLLCMALSLGPNRGCPRTVPPQATARYRQDLNADKIGDASLFGGPHLMPLPSTKRASSAHTRPCPQASARCARDGLAGSTNERATAEQDRAVLTEQEQLARKPNTEPRGVLTNKVCITVIQFRVE